MPGLQKARDLFTDTPRYCDPKVSLRLGLFLDDRLSGLAELYFGFPTAGDTYLGLMVLGPWAGNHGNGRKFLKYIEDCARQTEVRSYFWQCLKSILEPVLSGGEKGF